jgi:hypothetical protein
LILNILCSILLQNDTKNKKTKNKNKKGNIMIKHQKTCCKSLRISAQLNSKLMAYAEKKELSEAAVIRLALQKFLPTNTTKRNI